MEVIDYYQLVMGDYFGTLGIPIVAGRGFEPTDSAARRRVVVVNETMARRVWKGLDPIGRQVRPNLGQTLGYPSNAELFTVVGVANDVKQGGPDTPVGSEMYVSLDPLVFAAPTMNILLRTSVSPDLLTRGIERAVREVDASVPVVRLRDMDQVLGDSIRRPRLLAQLLSAFAAVALLLAAVGTYGVLSYMVTRRRREIGIRIAVGANRRDLIVLVMRQGLALAMSGVAIGLGGAIAANRLLTSLLFDVQPNDPRVLASVVVAIIAVSTAACGLPAWRASRVNPNVALRAD